MKIIDKCPNCKKKLYRLRFPYYQGKGILIECAKYHGGCGWKHEYEKPISEY